MSPRRNAITLGAPAGTNYLDPVSKVLSFVLSGTSGPVRIRQLEVISVGFGIAVTFSEFFENNMVDPNSVDPSFKDQIPPNYAANYDPDNGEIVKSNSFVSNLANVLNINPGRIRVVNIVPGNRRRRQLEAVATRAANGESAESLPYQYHRVLAEGGDDGLGVDFEISSVDPCAGVDCGPNGDCDKNGDCGCDVGWIGLNCTVAAKDCNGTFIASHVNCTDHAVAAASAPAGPSPTLAPTPMPVAGPAPGPGPAPAGSANGNNMPTHFTELVSVVSVSYP